MTIYADTLVFINTFVTYFLLRSTQLICRRPLRRIRLLAGSFLGGIYALSLLLQPVPIYIAIAARAAACMLICFSAFGFGTLRLFLRLNGCFLGVNGVFAGLMLALQCALPQIRYYSGIVYFDLHVPFLLLATLGIYILIRAVYALTSVRTSASHLGEVEIRVDTLSIKGRALFDTGHQLTDTFTGKPVVIIRPEFADSLVPAGVADFLAGKPLTDCSVPDDWQSRLRLFPYSGLGADGLLPAFRCDSVTIFHLNRKHTKDRIFVAAAPRTLYHGEIDALLPSAWFEEFSEGEGNHAIQTHRHPSSAAALYSSLARRQRPLHQRPADASASAHKARGNSRT